MAKIITSFRLEEYELKILRKYAKKSGRTQTDIVRELIRSLETKL